MLKKFTNIVNRIKRKFQNRKKRPAGEVQTENGIFEVKNMMSDGFSSCHQLPYFLPKQILDWSKNGEKIFHDIFTKTKADELNADMIDKTIDYQVALAVSDIDEQHNAHIATIRNIKLAQASRINSLKLKLESDEKEIALVEKKYPDISVSETNYVGKMQRNKLPFYKQSWVLLVIIGVSCLLDYTTVSSAIDTLLTQNMFLSMLLSIGTAMLINVTPSIAGIYAKNKDAENRKLVIAMLMGIFVVLFAILCLLRWATKDILFTDTSQLFTSSVVDDNSNGMAEIAMTILLSFEPALTSALSFVFGYIGATSEEKEKTLAEKRLATLHEEKREIQIRLDELTEVVEKDWNTTDEEQEYAEQLKLMETYRDSFKEKARVVLSELIARPEGNGFILQGERPVLFEI